METNTIAIGSGGVTRRLVAVVGRIELEGGALDVEVADQAVLHLVQKLRGVAGRRGGR